MLDYKVEDIMMPVQALRRLPPLLATGARSAAENLQESVQIRLAIPVRKAFVRGDESRQPPLSTIYRGGQSGIVAVRLYLALIWKSAGSPFDSTIPARGWATLLGLDDPSGLGQRRITRAIKILEDVKLIQVTRRPGAVPTIRLLNESGDGTEYSLPYEVRSDAAPAEKESNYYLKVQTRLWTTGQIQEMSGAALVMLLILLAEQADQRQVWFTGRNSYGPGTFEKWYWISHKTRAEGTRELVDRGLLKVTTSPTTPGTGSYASVFLPRKQRNLYRLRGDARPKTTKAASSS